MSSNFCDYNDIKIRNFLDIKAYIVASDVDGGEDDRMRRFC